MPSNSALFYIKIISVLFIIQAISILLKIYHTTDIQTWSWWIIMTPFLLSICFTYVYIIMLIVRYIDRESRKNKKYIIEMQTNPIQSGNDDFMTIDIF